MENHHVQWTNPLFRAIFHSYVNLPEGKSHEITLNHHFPMVFLRFSYGLTEIPENPQVDPLVGSLEMPVQMSDPKRVPQKETRDYQK